MADESTSLDILIRTLTDLHGAEAVQQSLGKVKAATKEASDESKKFSREGAEGLEKLKFGHHELHAALHVLGDQFGELGGLSRMLFSPWTIALGGILFLTKAIRESNEHLKAALDAVKGSIGDIAGAIGEVREEHLKADEAFKKSLETFQQDSNIKIDALHAEKKAVEEVAEARKKLELSQARTPEEKAAIEARYASRSDATNSYFAQAEINQRQSELDKLQVALTVAQRKTAGIDPQSLEARIKAAPGEISSLKTTAEQIQAAAEPYESNWKTRATFWLSPWNWEADQARQNNYDTMTETAQRMRGGAGQMQRNLAVWQQTQVQFDRQKELTNAITTLTNTINELKAKAGIASSAAGEVERIRNTQLLTGMGPEAVASSIVRGWSTLGTSAAATEGGQKDIILMRQLVAASRDSNKEFLMLLNTLIADHADVKAAIAQLRQENANARIRGMNQ